MRYTKELHERVRQNLRMFDYPRFDDGDIDALLDEIDRLEAELEKHRWIPVSERLQGEEVYIVEFQHGETGTCFVAPAYQSSFGCRHWMILRGNRFVNLPETYFASRFIRMPLPEPPKEETKC